MIMQFDSEKFINAVRGREGLWRRSVKQYNDKSQRQILWEEVAREMYPMWNTYEMRDRIKIGADLQKKWRNIRDAFVKELRVQRSEMCGTTARKKRKYIYFHNLDFLLHEFDFRSSDDKWKFPQETATEDTYYNILKDGTEDTDYNGCGNMKSEMASYVGLIQNTSEESNYSASAPRTSEDISFTGIVQRTSKETNYNEAIQEISEKVDYSIRSREINTTKKVTPPNPLKRIKKKRVKRKKSGNQFKEKLLEFLRDENTNSCEMDEDHSFFNSLIPSVQEFSSRQKLLFRMEVLKAIDKVQCMSTEELNSCSFQTPHCHCNKTICKNTVPEKVSNPANVPPSI